MDKNHHLYSNKMKTPQQPFKNGITETLTLGMHVEKQPAVLGYLKSSHC